MRKLIITFFVILTLFGTINITNAIPVETTADLGAIFPFCSGNMCDVPEGTGGFEDILSGFIQYILYIGALTGVLFVVVGGLMYSMSGMDDGLKATAKKRITQTLLGLLVLLLGGVILNLVAPWVYNGGGWSWF